MEKLSKCSKLLPYHIIAAAASGDVEAINKVLKHYEGYPDNEILTERQVEKSQCLCEFARFGEA